MPTSRPQTEKVHLPPLQHKSEPAKESSATDTQVMPPAQPQPPAHVSVSKGIAYVDNVNRLKVTGGYKVLPGDILKIGNIEFLVKEGKKDYKNYYIAGAAGLVAVLVLFTALLPGKSAGNGSVNGIVMDQASRALVPGASVTLKELKLKVASDNLGFFNFPNIPQGTYTVEATMPGFTIVTDAATVAKKKTTNLAMIVSPLMILPVRDDVTPPMPALSLPDADEQLTTAKTGALTVKGVPSNALVLLNNKQVGNGSDTYKNIKPGNYTVHIYMTGYQDWQRKITVKAGQTVSLQPSLERTSGNETGFQPSTFDDFMKVGKEAYQSGDFKIAVKNYNQAARLAPNRPEVYLNRGLASAKSGEKLSASADFQKAADMYISSERYSQAAEAYSYYLEVNPNDDQMLYQRGKTYLLAGTHDKAAVDLQKYVQANPKSLNGWIDLGRAFYMNGNYNESRDAYLKARKVNSMDKRVYSGLCLAYMGLVDRKSCKSSYDKFKELASFVDREKMKDDPEWRKVLGFLQIKDEG